MRFHHALLAAATAALVGCTAPATTPNPTAAPAPTQATAPAKPTQVGQATPAPAKTTSPASSPVAATYPMTIKDDFGRSVTIPSKPQRIVSLQPSNTEILYALGLGDLYVAGSDFDDYPEAAKSKPRLGGLQMSAEAIIAQRPDLVLASSGNGASLIQQLEVAKLPVLRADANNLEAVYADILMIGKATGAESAAQALVAKMKEQAAGVKTLTATAGRKPRVFIELDASDPAKVYTAGPGTFLNELIALASGENVAASATMQYPALSAEEVIRANPEVIILADAEFGTSPELVAKRPGWNTISAVKEGRIYPIGASIISRPGPRLVEALREVAKLLHPQLFS